jgi:hypothetical protein
LHLCRGEGPWTDLHVLKTAKARKRRRRAAMPSERFITRH